MKLKGIFQNSSTLLKICQFILVMLFFTALAIVLWWAFWGGRNDVVSLKAMQFIQSIGTFVVPSLLVAWLWSNKPWKYLHLNVNLRLGPSLLVVAFMLVAIPFINLLSYLNQQMEMPAFLENLEQLMQSQEESAAQLTERFLLVSTIGGLLFNLLLMAFIPAMGEELCFRGVLQNLFSEKCRIHLAIWLSAIIFSAIHFQFYGFVPRMLMGALFGYMLVWSGSLWLPMLAHFTNNAFAVVSYFVAYRQGWNSEAMDTIGTSDTLWLGIVSGVLVCGGIYLLRRSLTMNNASSRKSIGN